MLLSAATITLAAPFTSNYLAWLDERRRTGREVARLEVGSNSQIALGRASGYADFAARPLAGGRFLGWTRFVHQLRSTQGHVVIRVAPSGETYSVQRMLAVCDISKNLLTSDSRFFRPARKRYLAA
jgi:hypothetical protein